MRSLIVFFIVSLLFSSLNATDTIPDRSLSIGTGISSSFGKWIENEEIYKDFMLRVRPHFGYFMDDEWNIGIIGSYEFYRSNYDTRILTYGIGGFVGYSIPLRANSGIRYFERRGMYSSTRLGYMRINFVTDRFEGTLPKGRSLSVNNFFLETGLDIKLFGTFYLRYLLRMAIA